MTNKQYQRANYLTGQIEALEEHINLFQAEKDHPHFSVGPNAYPIVARKEIVGDMKDWVDWYLEKCKEKLEELKEEFRLL